MEAGLDALISLAPIIHIQNRLQCVHVGYQEKIKYYQQMQHIREKVNIMLNSM